MHHWGLHPTQPVTSQARDPRKPSPTPREDLPGTRTRALQGSQCKQPLAALLTYHREPLLIMIDGSPDRALRLGGVPHAYVFAPARARSPIQYIQQQTNLLTHSISNSTKLRAPREVVARDDVDNAPQARVPGSEPGTSTPAGTRDGAGVALGARWSAKCDAMRCECCPAPPSPRVVRETRSSVGACIHPHVFVFFLLPVPVSRIISLGGVVFALKTYQLVRA